MNSFPGSVAQIGPRESYSEKLRSEVSHLTEQAQKNAAVIAEQEQKKQAQKDALLSSTYGFTTNGWSEEIAAAFDEAVTYTRELFESGQIDGNDLKSRAASLKTTASAISDHYEMVSSGYSDLMSTIANPDGIPSTRVLIDTPETAAQKKQQAINFVRNVEFNRETGQIEADYVGLQGEDIGERGSIFDSPLYTTKGVLEPSTKYNILTAQDFGKQFISQARTLMNSGMPEAEVEKAIKNAMLQSLSLNPETNSAPNQRAFESANQLYANENNVAGASNQDMYINEAMQYVPTAKPKNEPEAEKPLDTLVGSIISNRTREGNQFSYTLNKIRNYRIEIPNPDFDPSFDTSDPTTARQISRGGITADEVKQKTQRIIEAKVGSIRINPNERTVSFRLPSGADVILNLDDSEDASIISQIDQNIRQAYDSKLSIEILMDEESMKNRADKAPASTPSAIDDPLNPSNYKNR